MAEADINKHFFQNLCKCSWYISNYLRTPVCDLVKKSRNTEMAGGHEGVTSRGAKPHQQWRFGGVF